MPVANGPLDLPQRISFVVFLYLQPSLPSLCERCRGSVDGGPSWTQAIEHRGQPTASSKAEGHTTRLKQRRTSTALPGKRVDDMAWLDDPFLMSQVTVFLPEFHGFIRSVRRDQIQHFVSRSPPPVHPPQPAPGAGEGLGATDAAGLQELQRGGAHQRGSWANDEGMRATSGMGLRASNTIRSRSSLETC